MTEEKAKLEQKITSLLAGFMAIHNVDITEIKMVNNQDFGSKEIEFVGVEIKIKDENRT